MATSNPISLWPDNGYKYSRAEMRRFMSRSNPQWKFFNRLAVHDTVEVFDDFLGDTINLDNYALGNGGGASAVAFAVTVAENGWIRATTGTANDATTTESLITPKIYYGDRNAWIEMRVKPVTAVTETQIELGFVDVVPGSNKTVVNALTGPATVNASVVDAAVFVYDHSTATTTTELVTIGGSITIANTAFTAPTAVAAGTAFTIRVALQGNHVYCWMDGVLVAKHNVPGTDYIEGGNAVAGFALITATNATSKSLDIDYIHIQQDRSL